MVKMLIEILLILLWCFAVYVCSYDWGDGRGRAESGNRFPEISK